MMFIINITWWWAAFFDEAGPEAPEPGSLNERNTERSCLDPENADFT